LRAGVNRISKRPWEIPANASSFRGRKPEAGISILAPRHVGGYTLLPPTKPLQRIFPFGDCAYAREAPSGQNRDFQLNRGQLRHSILWPGWAHRPRPLWRTFAHAGCLPVTLLCFSASALTDCATRGCAISLVTLANSALLDILLAFLSLRTNGIAPRLIA
jgi:hypothetical protein